MSETFAYTNAAGSTKTLTFAVAGRSYDASDSIQPNQISVKTAGGILLVSNLGEHCKQYEYSAVVYESDETYTDYADVLDFIGSTYVNMGEQAFTWTDHESTVRTVRITGGISFKRITPTHRRITMILEEDNT